MRYAGLAALHFMLYKIAYSLTEITGLPHFIGGVITGVIALVLVLLTVSED